MSTKTPESRRKHFALEDAQLRKWMRAKTPLAKSDGGGLTFTLSRDGTASWILRYRHGGQRRELTLGRYPDLGLAEARQRAAAERVKVAGGADVAVERRKQKTHVAAQWTVRELFRHWEATELPTLAATTANSMPRYIENDVLPILGTHRVQDVTVKDAYAVLDRVGKTRSYWAASNARKAGQMLFRLAVDRRMIEFNPFTPTKLRTVKPKPKVRKRIALEDSDIRLMLTSLDRMEEVDALLAQVLIYTGCRIGEALSAEWADIRFDLGKWRQPKDKIKTRKYMDNDHHDIELTPALRDVFLRLRELSNGTSWVFPNITTRKHGLLDHERALDRFKTYAATLRDGFPGVVFHDMRSTVRSGMRVIGIDSIVRKRAINHKVQGVDGVYEQSTWDEIAEAQRQWQRHLDNVRATPPAKETGNNVVALRRRAA